MARTLTKNIVWYHQPRGRIIDGRNLTRKQFEKLKATLLVEFRFWLRGPKTNIYWSRTYNAVAIRYRPGLVNYQELKEKVSSFIWGYFTALDL